MFLFENPKNNVEHQTSTFADKTNWLLLTLVDRWKILTNNRILWASQLPAFKRNETKKYITASLEMRLL